MMWRGSFVFLMTSFLLSSTSATAYDQDRRISDLEKQMLEIGAHHPSGVFGANFSASDPLDSEWELSAEALLWQAKVGGTQYAYSVAKLSVDTPTYPLSGTISEMSFPWSWGFRFGLGKEKIHDDCDLYLNYTRFVTSDSEGCRKDLPSGFLGLTGFLTPALVAKSKYKISYQNLDLEIGKAFFLSKYLLLRAFIGLKNAWITQKQNSEYSFDVQSGDLVSFFSELNDRCSFFGIGPRVGACSRWYLGREFCFIFRAAGSVMTSYYKVTDKYHAEETKQLEDSIKEVISDIDLEASKHQLSPFIEMLIGISWNKAFLKDKVVLAISLGYETLYFWRQNQFVSGEGSIQSIESSASKVTYMRFVRQAEDLGFRGVTLRFEVDF